MGEDADPLRGAFLILRIFSFGIGNVVVWMRKSVVMLPDSEGAQ